MLLLAPLFAFMRADFNVSYTELALALTVFNVVSGLLQTPVGFLVDRIGARVVLIAGLAVVQHRLCDRRHRRFLLGVHRDVRRRRPRQYGLSSRPTIRCCRITRRRSGSARSLPSTTFAGMVGSAIAPATLLFMQSYFGWRGAYIGASIFGLRRSPGADCAARAEGRRSRHGAKRPPRRAAALPNIAGAC